MLTNLLLEANKNERYAGNPRHLNIGQSPSMSKTCKRATAFYRDVLGLPLLFIRAQSGFL